MCVCLCGLCVRALLPVFIFYFYTFKISSDKTKAFEKRKERQAERKSRKVMGRKHRMTERDGDINSGDRGDSQWRLRLVLEGATEQMAAPQRERDHGRDIITLGLNSERHKERKTLKKTQESACTSLTLTRIRSLSGKGQGASLYYQLDIHSVRLQGLNTQSRRRYVHGFVLRIPSFASDLLHLNRWCREPPEVSRPRHKYKLVTEEVSQLQIYPTRAGVSPVRFDEKINDEKILETGPFIVSWLQKWQLL